MHWGSFGEEFGGSRLGVWEPYQIGLLKVPSGGHVFHYCLHCEYEQEGGQVVSLFDSRCGVKGFFGFSNANVDCDSSVHLFDCVDHALRDSHFGQY